MNVIGDIPNPPKTTGNSELDSLLREFDEIFHGIRRVTIFEHKISIDSSVTPVGQHLRRIPFTQQLKLLATSLTECLKMMVSLQAITLSDMRCETAKDGILILMTTNLNLLSLVVNCLLLS